MPEISEARYQELLASEGESKNLKAENSKMRETAENTKVALKEGREQIAKLTSEKATIEKDFETFKTDSETNYKKFEGFEDIKAKAEKFDKMETEKAKLRTKGIEEMKVKLGEDFMKENADFLEGLGEDKVETFLKKQVDLLDGVKRDVVVGTDGGTGTSNGKVTHQTEFDKKINSGDWKGALNAIPSPTKE